MATKLLGTISKADQISAYVNSATLAVFRQPRIQTRQYLDKYCINQSESRQGRNKYLIPGLTLIEGNCLSYNFIYEVYGKNA